MSSKEWIITSLLPISAFLYAWGGGGFKPARRFILPCILGAGAFLLGIIWYRALGVLVLSGAVFHLGYGESSPSWRKVLVILSHGLCLAPLLSGSNIILMLIPPLWFGFTYWFSRKFNWFTWKITELGNGFFIGTTLILMTLWK